LFYQCARPHHRPAATPAATNYHHLPLPLVHHNKLNPNPNPQSKWRMACFVVLLVEDVSKRGNIRGCPRTIHIGNAEIGTPRADMAQTARDSRVPPQMRGRHKNGRNAERLLNPREARGEAHTARKRPRTAALGQGGIANARGGI
jgi:hypothetical protein